MSNTLLPCPFCGGEAETFEASEDSFSILCTGCGVETPYLPYLTEAIAAWNRRAGDDTNVATNADRIRGMTDEELATEITKNPSIPCRMCEYYNHKLGHCDARRDFACVTAYAEALALEWLKQPAKEEHNETD